MSADLSAAGKLTIPAGGAVAVSDSFLPGIHRLDGWPAFEPCSIAVLLEHLLVREKLEEVLQIDRDQVVVRSYVGGLVKSFERRAA